MGSKASQIAVGALLLALPAFAPAAPAADAFALKSDAFLVIDEDSGETVTARNADTVLPIASLTKLMTALVVLEAQQPMDEVLTITLADASSEKKVSSRLRAGARLRRDELLLLALMASENRAAMALSRHYPGGRPAFIRRMNAKAYELGMKATWFADPSGLSSRNVSTARELQRLVAAAGAHPVIRDYSTRPDHTVRVHGRPVRFINSNRLVRGERWDIELQKTGFTNEAGRCLVMLTRVAGRRLTMIFLKSAGTLTRYGDASRVRQRVEAELRRASTGPQRALR